MGTSKDKLYLQISEERKFINESRWDYICRLINESCNRNPDPEGDED